jgi:predicted dehydrogenase
MLILGEGADMEHTEIQWGIIGPGKIAERFAQCVDVVEGASIHAVASRNPDRGKKFAKRHKVAVVYSSYEELVSDPEIDVVYIATPHNFHYENTKLCLEAGKHVLCEKPLTVNANQSERLIALAREKQLFLMEAMWTYFLPIYSVVRQWLDTGKIGEITFMTSTFGFIPNRDPDSRLFNPRLAGGTLLDIGIYNLAVSRWVVGQEVQSFDVRGLIGKTGVDEHVSATLEFEEDVISQFTCTFLSNTYNDFVIYGTKGHIRVHPNFWGATKATLFTGRRKKTVEKPMRSTGFEYEIEEVGRCLRAGLIESPVMTHEKALASMELMDAIRASIGLTYPFE